MTNKDINDTLKTFCELVVIENKPSNGKSSYFLIDNINITDSQPHILTKIATPIIEKSTTDKILSSTAEEEMESVITNQVEKNDNEY